MGEVPLFIYITTCTYAATQVLGVTDWTREEVRKSVQGYLVDKKTPPS